MKKLFLQFVLTLLPIVASADAVEIDGIYYNLIPKANNKIAEVTKNPNKYTGDIIIPVSVTYDGTEYNVTSIGKSAFYECSGLTSVTIPNSVTSIGGWAFYECSGLTSITIGNSVTSIGMHAFIGCSSLTSITIPNSMTSIESAAFEYTGLTSITIPNSVTSIGSYVFYGCTSLTYITIPESIKSIEGSTFEGCSGLTSVIIPNSVTSIGQGAFRYCSGLTSIAIPNSVTTIGKEAFNGCSGLTSVNIGNSVKTIEKEAFHECSGLTSVHIIDLAAWCNITFSDFDSNPLLYAHHLFLNGQEIKNLVIPVSVTSIGFNAFGWCYGLTSITIPSSVTSIGKSAFRDCSGLTSITIPNSVTSVGPYAFGWCSGLTSITIGSGVKGIGSCAFKSCPELADVYCLAEKVPSTESDAFQDSYIDYAKLHVPAASVAAYRAAEPWKNFGSIVAIDGETPEPKKCATPTINYLNGEIVFDCETEGVEYISEIKASDAKKYYGGKIVPTNTYIVTVYATKEGYENSEVVTEEITIDSGGLKGDMNGDGVVDLTDAIIVVYMSLGANM